jgi:hypothetical protein
VHTWENLQTRLFHLAYLGEELPEFVTTPGGSWLFRQILTEAGQVAAIAAAYIAECKRDPFTGAPVPGALPAAPDVTDRDAPSTPVSTPVDDDVDTSITRAVAACGVDLVITEGGDAL